MRTIELPASVRRELEQMRRAASAAEEGLIFPSQVGSPRHYGAFRRDAWNPATRATGITATPHDVHATCASLLVDAGASVNDVQAHLGHTDATTTLGIYARVRPGRSADLATRLDRLITPGLSTSA